MEGENFEMSQPEIQENQDLQKLPSEENSRDFEHLRKIKKISARTRKSKRGRKHYQSKNVALKNSRENFGKIHSFGEKNLPIQSEHTKSLDRKGRGVSRKVRHIS